MTNWLGSRAALAVAVLGLLVWLGFGPKTGFSSEWEDLINTITAIVTFLAVFIIQSSQTQEMRSIQIKLDALIRAEKGASDALLDLEEYDDHELKEIHERFEEIGERAQEKGEDVVPREGE
jgi:low affinity Fe/Cu permease